MTRVRKPGSQLWQTSRRSCHQITIFNFGQQRTTQTAGWREIILFYVLAATVSSLFAAYSNGEGQTSASINRVWPYMEMGLQWMRRNPFQVGVKAVCWMKSVTLTAPGKTARLQNAVEFIPRRSQHLLGRGLRGVLFDLWNRVQACAMVKCRGHGGGPCPRLDALPGLWKPSAQRANKQAHQLISVIGCNIQ